MSPKTRIVVVGSINVDLVIEVARVAGRGETLPGGDMLIFAGGKGANQACAAAKLGARTSMIGQIGPDVFGERVIESLVGAGVDITGVGTSSRQTGCALIQVATDGENAIVLSPGANATLDPHSAVARLRDLVDGGILLCQLEIPLETVQAVLALAQRSGARTILDPAPAMPLSPGLLRCTSILTPNQLEAPALLGAYGDKIESFDEAESAAIRLLELGPGAVIVKLGALGCYLATRTMRKRIDGLPTIHAVDTTGAGDVFNAALAVGLSEGKDIAEAAAFANVAAGISVTRSGAQSSIPTRDEVESYFSTTNVSTVQGG